MRYNLEHTNRYITTNIQELELGKWQKYLDERSVKTRKKSSIEPATSWNDDIARRVFVIPRAETSNYYRYRGDKTYPKFDLIKGESIEAQDSRLEEYFAQMARDDAPGCAQIMDELHRHFPSERWDEISAAVNFHIAQHRHLDDEFWGMTQNPEQVAARFNRQVHEYHACRNHYKEQFGLFGKPGGFIVKSYYHVPKTNALQRAVPFQEKRIRLDMEIASLYRTRGALGSKTFAVETERKRFKLPWWTVILFGMAGLAVLTVILLQMPRLIQYPMRLFFGATSAGVHSGFGKKEVTPQTAPQPSAAGDPTPPGQRASQPPEDKKPAIANDLNVKVTAVVTSRSLARMWIYLSDGRVIDRLDPLLTSVSPVAVEYNGTRYFYAKPVSRAAATLPAPRPTPQSPALPESEPSAPAPDLNQPTPPRPIYIPVNKVSGKGLSGTAKPARKP